MSARETRPRPDDSLSGPTLPPTFRPGSGGPSSYAEALHATPTSVEDTLLAGQGSSAPPRVPLAAPEPSVGPAASASAISGREETLAGTGPNGEAPGPRAPRREVPAKIGRYLVIEPLGEGGMGVVFAAYDPQLDRKVAIKLVRPAYTESSGGEAQARLVREAQALARLRHPNIVTVYEVGAFGDEVYVAMEFVDGVTLRSWQFEQARGWRDIVRVYLAAGRGLAAAHRSGLVHRDFKPDNVLVTRDGEPRVLDFGLAFRDAGAAAAAGDGAATSLPAGGGDLTVTGQLVGTPAYMSPEQHRGEGTDARTDVFAFSVALYEALYGTRPYGGTSLLEICASLFEGRITPPPSFIKIPAWLRRVVLRGLKIDPRERYQDMDAMLRDLGRDPLRYAALAAIVAVVVAVIVALALALKDADSRQSLRDQGARARADFDHRRAELLEAEQLRDHARAAAEHFNAWIVEAARARLEVSPVDALAALKHLRVDGGAWAAARGVAAEAVWRGVPATVWSTPAAVTTLTFVGQARWVVTGDARGRVELRTRAGEAVAGFDHHAAISGLAAVLVAEAADGARPAVRVAALADGELLLWDVAADAVHGLELDGGQVRSVALSPDGARVATGTGDGRLQLHAWAGAPQSRFVGHEAAVRAVAWAGDGLKVVSGGDDGAVILWNLPANSHRTLDTPGAPIRELRFDAASVLYSVAADRSGQIWVVDGDKLSTRPVAGVAAMRAGGSTRLDVDPRGAATLHHEDGEPRRLAAEAPVQAVDVDPAGRWAALGHARGVEIWDARARRDRALAAANSWLERIVWSPGGRWIAGTTEAGGLQLWDVARDERRILRAAGPPIEALFFSPDEARLVVADRRPRLVAWDLEQASPDERELPLIGDAQSVIGAGPLADGGVLQWHRSVVGGAIQALGPDGAQRWVSPEIEEIVHAALSPDGVRLAVAPRVGRPQLWRVDGATLHSEAAALGDDSHRWLALAHDVDSTRTRLAAAIERAGFGVTGFVVWEVAWDGAEGPTPHVLYEDDAAREVLRGPTGDAVLVLGHDHTHLWHLPSGAIHRMPPCSREVRGFALAREAGRAVLVGAPRGDAGLDLACFVDLAGGSVHRRTIVGEPWAWDGRRTLAGVRRGVEIELASDPTPEDPAVFLRWLAEQTPREIPLATLAGAQRRR